MDHHMKKILLSSVALLGLSAAAFAADLPSRRAAPAPYVAVPVFTWTGFYVGVNAGYGFSNNDNNGLGAFQAVPGSLAGGAYGPGFAGTVSQGALDRDNSGFVGGGQVGYNYQIGQWVIGIEADLQYADLNNSREGDRVLLTPAAGNPGIPGFVGARNANFGGIDWFGTVRGRLGYAMDRFMVYGTGGFAFGGADNNVNSDGFDNWRNHNDSTRTGYAAGGGIEYAFTPNLTGKIEGLYVNLERNRDNGFIGVDAIGTPIYTTATGRRNNDSEFGVVRAGLNYKFTSY
jgi:outer membrane immunogenic protein